MAAALSVAEGVVLARILGGYFPIFSARGIPSYPLFPTPDY